MSVSSTTTAPTRRDYGGGSIYQRSSDGRWFGSLESGWHPNGSRRRVTVSAATKAAVKVKLRRKARELEEGAGGRPGASGRTTVKAWSDDWLEIAERDLRPASYTAARSAVRKWIVPTIGHRRFEDLTPADVRAVAAAQRKAGRTSSTQLRTHSVLNRLLKAALDEGYAVPARVLGVKPPAKSVSDRTNLPVPLAVQILGQAAELPHGSRWVGALLQGLRQGEALGLTWHAEEGVDLERGRLTVSWQLQPLPYRAPRDPSSGFRVPDGFEARQLKGRMHLVRPKSKAGWRVIPLVPWFAASLETWREIAPTSRHGLVWPALDGGPAAAKADDAEWYALQTTVGQGHPAGRYFTVHEARHTTATLLLEAGVDPAVITAILGHSTIVTSRGYMHAGTDSLRDALVRVANRLELR